MPQAFQIIREYLVAVGALVVQIGVVAIHMA